MTKFEMIKRMNDVTFRVQGVNLQLRAGHFLRAAAATTLEERHKQIEASLAIHRPLEKLYHLALAMNVSPEEGDELPKPFCDLEKMSEEEIAEWLVNEAKESKSRTEK